MANQPRRGFFSRMFSRGPGTNNALTTTLKAAINRLEAATKNSPTALSVNQLVAKMNNTKNNNGRSVTNIFKKAIAGQFKIARNAVVAAAAGRIPQTVAAGAVNNSAKNIKTMNNALLGAPGPPPPFLPSRANIVNYNGIQFKKSNTKNANQRNIWYPLKSNPNTGNLNMNKNRPHLRIGNKFVAAATAAESMV